MVSRQHSTNHLMLVMSMLVASMGISRIATADEEKSASPAPEPPPEPAGQVEEAAKAAEPTPPEAPKKKEEPTSAQPQGPWPRAHHTAVYTASPGEPLPIAAHFDHPELIKRAIVVYTTPSGAEQTVVFSRSSADAYVALIPADAVKSPGLSYAIEIEPFAGSTIASFASRASMHPVAVMEDQTDARERAALARLGGRRSVISLGGEYVGFGENTASNAIPCSPNEPTCKPDEEIIPTIAEHFYRLEASYTYRSLRTVSEFGFRIGVVRGRSLKSLFEYEASRYDVGLNFGAARVRFRLLDAWQVEGELLTSITEEGFSSGVGASTLIGDPYGNKIVVGFESMGLGGAPFGNRFFSRIDITAGDRVMISPIIEVSDMPNAGAYAVRLLGDIGIRISGGLSAQIRGGYQARKSTSGGPGFGASLSYAF